MRRTNESESRDHILRDLWLKHGCPEKMMIHVRKTGETIILLDGLPRAQNTGDGHSPATSKPESGVRQPVTLTCICTACRREFSAKRMNAQFCSERCRKSFNREREAKLLRRERERLLAAS